MCKGFPRSPNHHNLPELTTQGCNPAAKMLSWYLWIQYVFCLWFPKSYFILSSMTRSCFKTSWLGVFFRNLGDDPNLNQTFQWWRIETPSYLRFKKAPPQSPCGNAMTDYSRDVFGVYFQKELFTRLTKPKSLVSGYLQHGFVFSRIS